MRRSPVAVVALATSIAISSGASIGCGAAGVDSTTTSSVPADARTTDLSLFDVDCAECAEKIVVELKKEGTVYRTSFDKKRVVLHVVAAPSFTPPQMLEAVKRAGFRAELGDKGGAYVAEAKAPEGADVATPVDDGHDVADLKTVAVAGKITVVDFYADWCGPCHEVDKHVKDLISKRADLAYRRMNVVDWDSPLAAHYMKGVPNLPYVVVFAADGRQVDAISGLDLARLDAAIAKAK